MSQHHLRRAENVVGFHKPAQTHAGAHALNLVHQAADVLSGIEEQARQSQRRAVAAERAHQELLTNADRKLLDASRALEEAQKRIEALQNRVTAFECRAQAAEAEAHSAKQALALVEEAIRRRLLFTHDDMNGQMNAVA
ncbi:MULTISPECIES: hypothetical protein [unclassified Bradyrhizobium]|jgi:predicted  nucleic acid-binding Zn-ribbon protein|uniref:hypothetical protein n=1 Tax=unclassified Bradyrhizobium TaxID=2631580 RepID=UPI001FFB9686|nr:MULTISPECIES: hypothetical protein [unclassified Bradyrhizobium]